MTMKIRPSMSDANGFVLRLSAQEMKNIRDGLLNAHIHPDSPWTRGAVEQINAALADHATYQAKRWDQ